jgi:hypothetical protein
MMKTAGRVKDSLADTYEVGSGATTRVYSRAVEYTRAHPQTAALVALGSGIAVGMFLSPARRRGFGSLLPVVAIAAANALVDQLDRRR